VIFSEFSALEQTMRKNDMKGHLSFLGAETHDDTWTINLNAAQTEIDEKSLLILGDVALARKVGAAIDENGSSYPFSALKNEFFNADYKSFVLECCLSTNGIPWEPKPILMAGKPDALKSFPSINDGTYIANIANNHFLDYGEGGAEQTLRELENQNVRYIGIVSHDIEQPEYIDTGEGIIAFFAYSPAGHKLPSESSLNLPSNDIEQIARAISTAKKQADIVIVQMHQGIEYSHFVDRTSRSRSVALIDAGADLVVCHHTHTIQGIERYNGGFIFHGIGNFLIDLDLDTHPSSAFSLAIRCKLHNGRLSKIVIEPYRVDKDMRVYPLDRNEFVSVGRQLDRLSALLTSRSGLIATYLRSDYTWLIRQYIALLSMFKRVGVKDTISYYLNRIVEKLTGA
jgi:hypothetical protein